MISDPFAHLLGRLLGCLKARDEIAGFLGVFVLSHYRAHAAYGEHGAGMGKVGRSRFDAYPAEFTVFDSTVTFFVGQKRGEAPAS